MPESTQTPIIERFVLGPFETNCYVVSRPEGDSCWVADAGYGAEAMAEHIKEQGRSVEAIVLTHAHADHIGGLDDLAGAFPDAPVYLHQAEHPWLTDPMLNLSAMGGQPLSCNTEATQTLEDGQALELLGQRWRVLHTPGHSPGSVSLALETTDESAPDIAIVGDTLFNGSIGRSDFPTSDEAMLHRMIREKLYALPDDTAALPGHGPPTSIGREKQSNPFVRAD